MTYHAIKEAVAAETHFGNDSSPLREIFTGGPSQNFRRAFLGVVVQCFQQITGINIITYYAVRTRVFTTPTLLLTILTLLLTTLTPIPHTTLILTQLILLLNILQLLFIIPTPHRPLTTTTLLPTTLMPLPLPTTFKYDLSLSRSFV